MNYYSNINIASRLLLVFFVGLVFSCTKDEADDKTEEEKNLPTASTPINITHIGPTYSDNYTTIADWSKRDQWELANVHDPSVAKEGEYFYMVQTDASYGNAHDGHGHFHARRSKDLVKWEYIGSTMDTPPTWVKDSINANRVRMELPEIENPSYAYWAPCIRKVGSVYRMYYSLVVLDLITGTDSNYSWGERPYIGMMETADLASNVWEDKGMVITAISDGKETFTRTGGGDWSGYYKFNAIDPSYLVGPDDKHWLVYGSWHTGIAKVEIDPITGKPFQLETEDDYGLRIAGRGDIQTNRWQALEGPEIIYNPNTDYYYLFLAYDELSVAYNTRVARSRSIDGPFLGFNGENVSQGAEAWPMLSHPYKFYGHPGWVGFSHCAVFQDEATGKWFYSSQGRYPENVPGINASNALMMGHIREMKWTADGWPVIDPERYADVPDIELTDYELLGKWEFILMDYQYQTMQTSKIIYLNEDKSVSGSLSSTWTFDKENMSVNLGGIECKVFISYDWESTPRRVTLTLSGYENSGRPLWAKKVF
jgi:arabinan endo-1,5-alpha-L-arabinosidase